MLPLVMQSIVLSLGGSVILSDEADSVYLKRLAQLLKKISTHYKLFIIVGGGKIARQYIQVGRTLGFTEQQLDQLGIDVTRVNARILAYLLNCPLNDVPTSTDTAIAVDASIVVMGGTTPDHSTDFVAAEIAKKTGAVRFVNATNVDGIYDKDPKKYPNAQRLSEIHINVLIDKYGTEWDAAGKNVILDGPSLDVIRREKIPTFVVNGKRLDQLENALSGRSFLGTSILI